MPVIIISISVILLFCFVFFYISRKGKKMVKEQNERINKARRAKAKILGYSVSHTRGTGNQGHFQVMKFTLEILCETPYKTKALWEVYPMAVPLLQEGSIVNVKIDVYDKDIIYPGIPSVNFSWSESKNSIVN